MRRNIRLMELQYVMMSLLFVIPVLVPYFQDQIGLTFQDFLISEAIFAFTIVVLEVPSGWVSDIWKRTTVLWLSGVFWTVGFAILCVAESFAMAVLFQVVMGIAVSLTSGTQSALLYDTLLVLEAPHEFSRLEGRRMGYSFYALAGASVVSGFLYEISPTLPVALCVLAGIVATLIALFMQEPPRHKSAIQHHPLADMMATMRYALQGHALVGAIIMFSAAFFCSTKLIMWMQQPYYLALQIPEAWFGVFMAIGYGLSGFASHINHLVERWITAFQAVVMAWSLALCVAIGSAISVGWHGVVLLIFGGSFIFGLFGPRVNDAINRRVGSERRATILSTANLLRQLAFVPLSLLVGWGTEGFGVSGGLYAITAWLILAGLCLVFWSTRQNKRQDYGHDKAR